MARIRSTVCRLCRREGMKLFLKGNRCFTEKCAIEKRNFAPGQHGKRRVKMQGYGIQLREKQKVKRTYGMLEKQFRLAFQRAARKKGVTGELLLSNLERRLDNIVYRLGFAASRPQARQLVAHGHVLVDGRRVDVPSFLVRPGQAVSLRERLAGNLNVQGAVQSARARGVPSWLSPDLDALKGSIANLPRRDEITLPIQEQLIVELYSK
ncbi:MAG TPA: 30S ribosomal protein S4 [Candidatus Polarisedimenticolia bacterium]|nr:30S ribosomal protein S4 [Candidatus Polarisedimenticolia bacterium]